MTSWVEGGGVRYRTPSPDRLDRRLANADHPGRHLWVLTAAWLVADPESREVQMDAENLITVQGPGCFKCEQPYSRRIAAKPCRGTVDYPHQPSP
jgi:hypothetical protein